MTHEEQDAKNRIIRAAIEILNEVSDAEKVTVRQVAERANVGVGLINYHFGTKDKLLAIALGDVMAKMAGSLAHHDSNPHLDPVARLKAMLKELYEFAERHEKIMKFLLTHGILNGNMQTPLFLIPALKDIFGDTIDEIKIRIIALQIILPIQVTSLSPMEFHMYSGIDLHQEAQRNHFIDNLVDNLVNRSIQNTSKS